MAAASFRSPWADARVLVARGVFVHPSPESVEKLLFKAVTLGLQFFRVWNKVVLYCHLFLSPVSLDAIRSLCADEGVPGTMGTPAFPLILGDAQ